MPDIRAGRLVTVLERFSFVRLTVHAITPAAATAPKVRAFIDVMSAYLKSPPWAAGA
jgi:DNA-binding transcriptional LysR family regulator